LFPLVVIVGSGVSIIISLTIFDSDGMGVIWLIFKFTNSFVKFDTFFSNSFIFVSGSDELLLIPKLLTTK